MPLILGPPLLRKTLFALVGLLLALAAGCTPAPPVVVLAPSATPAGAVVPTRAPTGVPSQTPRPATATGAPTPPPSATPLPGVRLAGQTVTLSVPVATVDSAWSGEISDDAPWAVYPLQGPGGEWVDLKLEGVGGLRPFLLLLDSSGREIARSAVNPDAQQAVIRGAALQSSGTHYAVVTRDGGRDGSTAGRYTLTITRGAPGDSAGDFSAASAYETLDRGEIDPDQAIRSFTFEGRAGDILTVQVMAEDGDLDPRLVLSDALGNILAANDDDPLGGSPDAALHRFVLPADGYYTLAVSAFGATTGEFSFKLSREGQAGPDDPEQARLDVVNSASIRDDQARVTDFRAGDQVTEGGELRVQTLVTYHLPLRPAGGSPVEASLWLHACAEEGAGFAGFEPLAVSVDWFGDLNVARDFTRPQAGARLVAEMSSCGSVDVSEAVNAAYAEGSREIQFRLGFPAANGNGQTDEVRFDPRLLISAAG